MIPEWGHLFFIIALVLACVQATLPLWGSQTGSVPLMRVARYTAGGQFFFMGLSFTMLAVAFLMNDFSVAYVAENSHTQLPWIYRICAVWGAHEGSMLLWALILSGWGWALSVGTRRLPLADSACLLAVMAWVAVGIGFFILITSNPFLRLLSVVPTQGHDLNPLLQDPGMVGHPPLLYMGYVGFSVAFAFAITALIQGRFDVSWARDARPWTLVAWIFLTVGIVLGSWWAYRELGWGGWWFWDPVENASFMPWLSGTALLHSLIVTYKRQLFRTWTVFLAITTFSLSLLGTFLVRSGVLISVHAFAVDPTRGLYILMFFAAVVGLSLLLFAWRGHRLSQRGYFSPISRESFLLFNNLLLFVAMATVLLGTLYPLVVDVLDGGKISVGAPYFNTVFVPLMMPLIILMGMAPHCRWYEFNGRSLCRQLYWTWLLVAILTGVMSVWLAMVLAISMHVMVVVGVFLVMWLMVHTGHAGWGVIRQRPRHSLRYWGMLMAHFGFAVAVLGVVLVSSGSQKLEGRLAVGGHETLGAYRLTLVSVVPYESGRYRGDRATMMIQKNQGRPLYVYPETRHFLADRTTLSKTAIHVGVFRDLYVALGQRVGSHEWVFRFYNKPFVRWIWYGGLMIALGGCLAWWGRPRVPALMPERGSDSE